METPLPPRIRTFIALFPPMSVAEPAYAAGQAAKTSFSAGSISWTGLEQLHLTLQFLGNIDSGRLSAFESALSELTTATKPFRVECKGLGCFPTVRRPRVLWAGLTGHLEPIQELKRRCDAAMESLGIAPEERKFHPHLTLGRIKELNGREKAAMGKLVDTNAETHFGSWTVDRLDFMRSQLSPKGSTYTVLKSFYFRQHQQN